MQSGVTYEESLVSRIRDLIDGYPKNSILKEYLQNADDSGATELIVTYDRRIHKSLVGTNFEAAKPESLLLYNNASFKSADFDSIVKISAQGKINEAGSTGRFGQGFSSSFSVSDHPSFVSSGKLYWFDVLHTAVSRNLDTSIQVWSVKEDGRDISDWLATFNIHEFNSGTIFRLPLRNDETASQSDISHEIFKYKDFLEWCDEWKSNTSDLLFLRHIQKLVLQEIDEDGEKHIHVEISTKNTEEISEYNNKIQNELSGNAIEICNQWKESNVDLPMFTYKHVFLVRNYDRSTKKYADQEENWAVVNGLFRGADNCLIDQAFKVLGISPNPRKALPWVGVAVPLDEKGLVKNNNTYKYYSFLPLPIKSKHPLHIHGWFDLNPKRTEITHDGAGDDKSILIQWNQLLFKEGVGTAWAILIDYIKDDCELKKYYSLWPRNQEDEFDGNIAEGFYRKINTLRCFRTRYKQEKPSWKKPADNIFFLRSRKDKNLFSAFINHFSIISPTPTNTIIDELNNTGTTLKEVTPKLIRDYLTESANEINFPCALQDVPVAMLSQKDWLLSIFVFCAEAEENGNYENIESLPLELDSGSKLHIPIENKLLDSDPKLAIFDNDRSLFIHPDIIDVVSTASILPSPWLKPNLKNYLIILHGKIDTYEITNKEWLKSLVSVITEADEDQVSAATKELNELQVIYQSDGELGNLKADAISPFLVFPSDGENIGILETTGMAIVHPDYAGIYEPLLKQRKSALIKDLNSHTLAMYLLSKSANECDFFKDQTTREYLLELLSQDTSWIDKLSEGKLKKLNKLPLIATESGNIYAKSDEKKLYLSKGFTPPKHIHNLNGEYEIIIAADENQQAMYRKIGFQEQNPTNYLKQIIIPFIGNSPVVDDVKSITEWLAVNWVELTEGMKEKEISDLIIALSNSKIVFDSALNLGEARNYYHPTFFYSLPKFLQDKAYLPTEFPDEKIQACWSELLLKLSASTAILPAHIVSTVESIAKTADSKKSIALLNYISNNFEFFNGLVHEGTKLFDHLSSFSWIAVDRPDSKFLAPAEEYSKLRIPKEVILRDDYLIAGGAHYAISKEVKLGKKDDHGNFPEKLIARILGLLVNLPAESVFESFLCLRDKASQNNRDRILRAAKSFYRYLGRISDITEINIPDSIKERSVLIKGQWISSRKVFQDPIDLSRVYCWKDLLSKDGEESDLATGLVKLGIRKRPDNEALAIYLNDLPQYQRLERDQLRDAKSILWTFQQDIRVNELDIDISSIPILSDTNQLISNNEIYIKDLPAYDISGRKDEQINFCQRQFDAIAKFAGVLSLAENVQPELDYENSRPSHKDDDTWNAYLRSDPLRLTVLRLMHHETKNNSDAITPEQVDHVLPPHIRLMDSLVVKYFIGENWIYDDLDSPAFHDSSNDVLFLLSQDDDEDMCESIAKFIGDSAELTRENFLLVNRILRHKTDSVDDVNNLLDRKNIKSLPNEIEFDEEYSLYSGCALDQSPIVGEDVEQHREHVSPIPDGATKSSHDRYPSGEDVAPPTAPKKINNDGGESLSNEKIPASHLDSGNRGRISDVNKTNSKSNGSPKSNGEIVSSNDRKPVYVGSDSIGDASKNSDRDSFAIEIGAKGENYIIDRAEEYLINTSNRLERAPTKNNEGFDILEFDSGGEIVRYIEVKTLTGKWAEGGVSITTAQLEFAQDHDNWWLFVIENINTQDTTVYTFRNPVVEANRFVFDGSWKSLSEARKNIDLESPQRGSKYVVSGESCEIIDIKPMGKLYSVLLKNCNTGSEGWKKFNPSWVLS